MEIGKLIKDLRMKAGLSQGQLAKSVGITSSAVSQIESGKVEPKKDILDAIANELLPGAKGKVLWALSVTENDIPEHKREIFNKIMPGVKNLIETVWGLNKNEDK